MHKCGAVSLCRYSADIHTQGASGKFHGNVLYILSLLFRTLLVSQFFPYAGAGCCGSFGSIYMVPDFSVRRVQY